MSVLGFYGFMCLHLGGFLLSSSRSDFLPDPEINFWHIPDSPRFLRFSLPNCQGCSTVTYTVAEYVHLHVCELGYGAWWLSPGF